MKITYSFWGNRGVLDFEIYNKLSSPIYVDWKKSSYIYRNRKLNFWVETEIMNTATIYDDFLVMDVNRYSHLTSVGVRPGSISSSTKEKPERITFIPPKSNYRRNQFYLFESRGVKLSLDTKQQDLKSLEIGSFMTNDTTYMGVYPFFNEQEGLAETTDLFRNFLTFSLSEEMTSEFYVDNSFYIKAIYEYNLDDLSNAAEEGLSSNDKFYIVIPESQSIEYRKKLVVFER
jgi:hypothetical protein